MMNEENGDNSALLEGATTNPNRARATRPVTGIKPPDSLRFDEDIISKWKIFIQKWNIYKILTDLEKQEESYQVALLLHTLGDEALRRYNGFSFDSEESDRTVKEIIEKFNEYVVGEVNETYERYVFNKRKQDDNETFDTFLTAIRVLVKTCNYCNVCIESLLRDRIVLGIKDMQLQEQLLRERSLTLEKCIDMCRASEHATVKGKAFRPETINKVREHRIDMKKKKADEIRDAREPNQLKSCRFCGKKHPFKKELCPAWGKICTQCKKKNHFAKQCHTQQTRSQNVHHMGAENEEEWINKVHSTTSKDIKCIMLVNDIEVKFQIDTGATVNLLPKTFASGILPTTKVLKMWNGNAIKPLGIHRERVVNPKNRKKYNVEFTIVENETQPLLGCRAAEAMNLITVQEKEFERVNQVDLDRNTSLFSEELGSLPGKVQLNVNPQNIPTAMPVHRIPIAMRPKLKEELERLEKKGVIVKVEEPTQWVSNIVIVEKPNGKIRLCLNPMELNKALQRPRFTMPILEDVLHELEASDTFTKLDLRDGYWQCELEDESSYLTTFQTSFGRYRWTRMPFGLSVASEIFQLKMKESFEGLPGLINIADDILIHGKGSKEHDENLERFFQKCKKLNVKLNKDKLELKSTEIKFMGHVISKEGLRPDPVKTKAITDMKKPKDIEELRRFLGMSNYQIKFVPGYANVVEPLRNLLKKEVAWNWTDVQDKAFSDIKKLLTEPPTLKIFDVKKEVIIECDASQFGIGAVLKQGESTVAYASRTMNTTERNYAQIEKEMLAVCWSLEKFHHYVYGRQVVVYTDHKPLEAIKKKPLHKAPKRLQLMLLKTQRYNYELIYKPGKNIPVPDTLSRAPLEISTLNDDNMVLSVNLLPIKGNCLERIIEESRKDEELTTLKEVILKGWPEAKEEIPSLVRAYFDYRDELVVQNGIVVRGERIVIPKKMRKELKEKIHIGHQGINSCLKRARELIYWPGMSSEIRQFIGACHTCLCYSDKPRQEPLKWHIVPERPWQKVGTDIFMIKGRCYLVTVDYFSQFIEVDFLGDTTSKTVITKLKHHFARYGIPEVIVSGNDTQLVSKEFEKFCEDWEIFHKRTSPYNSKSNGQAESAVKIAKRIMRKAMASGEDPYIGLLNYRNTPLDSIGKSPAQLLLGKRTRTLIPTSAELFRPSVNIYKDVKEAKQMKKFGISQSDRRNKTDLPNLMKGDVVYMLPKQKNEPWKKAHVTQVITPRRMEVTTEKGDVYVRNRMFLRKPAVESFNLHKNVGEEGVNAPGKDCQVKQDCVKDCQVKQDCVKDCQVKQDCVKDYQVKQDYKDCQVKRDCEPMRDMDCHTKRKNISYQTRSGRHVIKPKKMDL